MVRFYRSFSLVSASSSFLASNATPENKWMILRLNLEQDVISAKAMRIPAAVVRLARMLVNRICYGLKVQKGKEYCCSHTCFTM
jgi:hypothetical protein